MKGSWIPRYQTPADVRLDVPLEASVRIPLHKGRIVARTLGGLLVALASGTALVLGTTGTLSRYGTVWQQIALAIAIVSGISAMLQGIAQLQNAEPGLVVGPRGLTVHTQGAGALGPIPWNAVSKLEARRHRGRPYVAVQLREAERFLPDRGILGNWLCAFNRRIAGGALTLSPQWLQVSMQDLESLLQRYFTRYGNPGR